MSSVSGKQGHTVTWGPLSAVLFTVVTFLLSQLLVILLFGIFFSVAGWPETRIDEWTDSTSGQFMVVAAGSAATFGLVWWFLRRKRSNLKAIGFSKAPQWRDVGLTLLGFVVYFGLLIAAVAIAGQLGMNTEKEQEIGFEGAKAAGEGLVFVFISLVILPPFIEEILFRGVLFGGLRTKLNFIWATIITSGLFAVPHLFATSDGFLWVAAVDTFVLSLVLCYMRERTGVLWVPIGIHAIKNALAFVVLFVV